MKILTKIIIAIVMIVGLTACVSQDNSNPATAEMKNPSVADLQAFKVYHHMVYMVTTAKEAGGTNKLSHTRQLTTEGTDPVVTPALDHIYTKAVIDLSEGPVIVEMPKITDGRYYSIHITDQEHYTIYDEIHPVGKYDYFVIRYYKPDVNNLPQKPCK